MQYDVEDTSVLPCSGKNLCELKQVRSESIFNMAVNVNTCTIVKRFKCGTCRRFLCNLALLQPDRIHTGEKPCKCDTSGAQFSDSGNLKKHIRIPTGHKPYKCDACDAQLSTSGNLKKHVYPHWGETLQM